MIRQCLELPDGPEKGPLEDRMVAAYLGCEEELGHILAALKEGRKVVMVRRAGAHLVASRASRARSDTPTS